MLSYLRDRSIESKERFSMNDTVTTIGCTAVTAYFKLW